MNGPNLFAGVVVLLALLAMIVAHVMGNDALFAIGAFFIVIAGAAPQFTSSRP